jgi:hypothetical protein
VLPHDTPCRITKHNESDFAPLQILLKTNSFVGGQQIFKTCLHSVVAQKKRRPALAIQPGFDLKTRESIGYPYGTLPRLLLFWMTTEAVRTNRALELG